MLWGLIVTFVLFFGDTTADKPYRDGSGRPLAGAVLTVWKHGTTSPATVIGEDGFPMSGPFVTDENGVLPNLYLDPEKKYRVRMVDARGVLVFDVDPYVSESALFRSPIYHARDEDDMPIAGATLAFFSLNTGLPKDTYADGEGLAEHPNPIRADAGGFFPPIWLESAESPAQVYEVVPSFGDAIFQPPVGARFVAVASAGDGARIAWSDDGKEWHAPDTEPAGAWRDVTYSPRLDLWVAVGDSNAVIKSADAGRNWEECEVPEENPVNWTAVIWTGKRFVAGQGHASSTVAADSFLSSEDAETWTRAGANLGVSFNTRQFATHEDVTLAAGNYSSSSEGIAVSINGGATWSGFSDIPGIFGPTTGVIWSEILESFVSGDGTLVAISEDGLSWTTLANQGIGKLWEFREWGRMFTIITGTGLIGSEDGEGWSTIFSEPTEVNLSGIASSAVAQTMVLVGRLQTSSDVPQIFWTSDLSSFSAASSPPDRATWQSVASGLRVLPPTPLPQRTVPTITAINPNAIEEGSDAFVLTVTGTGFLPPSHQAASVVRWNGSARNTTFVSDTELQADITADDVSAEGVASVTVTNDDLESNAAVFTIAQEIPRDPFFANVISLIGIEDTVTDAIGVANVSLAGTSAPSDNEAKFGDKSLASAGGSQNASGLRLSADDGYFTFPGEFTIEAWFYITTLRSFYSLFDGQRNHPDAGSWTLQGNSNGALIFIMNGNFSSGPNTGSGAVSTNTWHHIAITRDGDDDVRIFVDGVQKGNAVTRSGTMGGVDSDASSLNVSRGIASDNWSFAGYVEEVRITKGVARYTSNFTPPDAPFPRHGP